MGAKWNLMLAKRRSVDKKLKRKLRMWEAESKRIDQATDAFLKYYGENLIIRRSPQPEPVSMFRRQLSLLAKAMGFG